MREKAQTKGANAIVFAESVLTDESEPEELTSLCFERARFPSFARGWAVVLKDSPPASAKTLTIQVDSSASSAELECALMMTLDTAGTEECVLVVGSSDIKGRPISVSAGGVQIHGLTTCDDAEIRNLAKTHGAGLIMMHPPNTRVVMAWRGEGGWHVGGYFGGNGESKGSAPELLRTYERVLAEQEGVIAVFLFDFAQMDNCVVSGKLCYRYEYNAYSPSLRLSLRSPNSRQVNSRS